MASFLFISFQAFSHPALIYSCVCMIGAYLPDLAAQRPGWTEIYPNKILPVMP